MERFGFKGHVLPEFYSFTRDEDVTLAWSSQRVEDLPMRMKIQMKDGDVIVLCEAPIYSTEILHEAYVRAFDASRAIVNFIGLINGIAFTVILDRQTDPTGEERPVVIRETAFAEISTAYGIDPEESLLELVLTDPPIFQAIADLMAAISWPSYSPIGCGRVVDSLRRLISSADDPEMAWSEMRQVLKVDKSYLQFVTHHSRGPRHGDRVWIPGDVTSEITRRAWTLMCRFLLWKRSGNAASEGFEVLRG